MASSWKIRLRLAWRTQFRYVIHGLTHLHCACGRYKGLTWAACCASCQLNNLKNALEFDDEEWSAVLRGLSREAGRGRRGK
jgi:hypothetical protein